MNVRAVLLFSVLALQGCDWAAAESLARCNAGELEHCDGGAATPDAGTPDAGTPDAGTPDAGTDAGTPDAGTPDAGTPDAGTPDAGTLDAGTPDAGTPDAGAGDAGVSMTVGLFPHTAGLWHVFNEGGQGVVRVIDGGVVRETRLSGAVVQAYADSPHSTWLALLVGEASTMSLVVVDPFDGGTFETPAQADLVSVYQTPDAGPAVSVWSSSGGMYRQRLLIPNAMRALTEIGNLSTPCVITFDDLEVLQPPVDRAVVAYHSGVCPPAGPSVNVAASAIAIQAITPSGDRELVNGHVTGVPHRVGRSSAGFDAATQSRSRISTSRFVWSSGFSVTSCSAIELVDGGQLQLGDVSDGLVTGVLEGEVRIGTGNATLSTATTSAFLARTCATTAPWVVNLGPAALGARVPVLVQGSRVFVSVQRPDGGVELLDRDANDGT